MDGQSLMHPVATALKKEIKVHFEHAAIMQLNIIFSSEAPPKKRRKLKGEMVWELQNAVHFKPHKWCDILYIHKIKTA